MLRLLLLFFLCVFFNNNLLAQCNPSPSATAFGLSATCLNDVPEDNAYLQLSLAEDASHYNFSTPPLLL